MDCPLGRRQLSFLVRHLRLSGRTRTRVRACVYVCVCVCVRAQV